MIQSRFSGVWASYPQVYPQVWGNPNPDPDDRGSMNTYPDTELMEAYDRWCEAEYDTEGHGDWYADEPDYDEAEPDHDEVAGTAYKKKIFFRESDFG